MAVTMRDVCDLFERYGWTYQVSDGQTLLTGFTKESRSFLVDARLEGDWLTLNTASYLPPVPEAQRAEINRDLLRLNSRIAFVRFALDPEDQIMIMVDLPAYRELSYELFQGAIEHLAEYAYNYYPHLYELITGEEPTRPGGDHSE